jgi:ABC-type multidrug transport system fused ATPase/permease subunit
MGRTCLTIAHRLSTIQNCEKIAVVNRGKLVEEVSVKLILFSKHSDYYFRVHMKNC